MARKWLGWLCVMTSVFWSFVLFVDGWDMMVFNLALAQVLIAVEYISNPKGVSS